MWKPLLAKISSYVPSGLGARPNVRLYSLHHGEVSPRHAPALLLCPHSPVLLAFQPCLFLAQNLDVGAELVRLGYAIPCPQEEEEEGTRLPKEATAKMLVSRHRTRVGSRLSHLASLAGASASPLGASLPPPAQGHLLAAPKPCWWLPAQVNPVLSGAGECRLWLPCHPHLRAPDLSGRDPPGPSWPQPFG